MKVIITQSYKKTTGRITKTFTETSISSAIFGVDEEKTRKIFIGESCRALNFSVALKSPKLDLEKYCRFSER